MEPGLYAVQPRRPPAEQPASAAQEEHRHRDGPGADGFGVAGSGFQLPYRHPAAHRPGRGRSVRREVRPGQRRRAAAASDYRSRAGLHVRHPRKRLSRPEQGKVRHPPPAAARGARRPPVGHARTVPLPPGAGGGGNDEKPLPGTARNPATRGPGHPAGRSQLLRHDRRGTGTHRPGVPAA